MSEMVERLGTAISEAIRKNQKEGYEPGDFNVEEVARAAIAAMREPTKEILALAEPMAGNELDWQADEETLRSVWRAMIDEALK